MADQATSSSAAASESLQHAASDSGGDTANIAGDAQEQVPGHVPMAERLPLPDWGGGSAPSEPSVDDGSDHVMVSVYELVNAAMSLCANRAVQADVRLIDCYVG
jgi:hypothetical protein